VAASALVRDVYQKVIRKDAEISQERLVLYSRVTVALVVGVALVLGWLAQSLVFWLVLFAWAGLGAALGPTSILALYWGGTTRAGVFAGLVTGTAVTFIWNLTPTLDALVYELIPAFALALLATVAVSRVTLPPPHARERMAAMEGSPAG
jgi:Na+/proline symporter